MNNCECQICCDSRAARVGYARARAERTAAEAAVIRRSARLAAKPAVNYAEEELLSEREQRRLDRRGGLSWHDFVCAVRAECDCSWPEAIKEAFLRQNGAAPRSSADFEAGRLQRMTANALRVQANAEAAVARQEAANKRRAERIVSRIERDQAVLASMPAAPPRLERQDAVTEGPALAYTEATGCELLDLPPPPSLRRTCQLPGCDEHCTYCRGNDRIAAENRGWNPRTEPHPTSVPQLAFSLAPPPIGATVVRVPVDLRLMSQESLRELIAAAAAALDCQVEGLDFI